MIDGRMVRLRPIEPSDLEFMRDLTNHPAVAGMVVGWDFPVSRHGQLAWLESIERSASTKRLAIVDRESGEVTGLTGLWDIDWHNRSALSATKIHPDRARPGMGTDAIKATMAWAFSQVNLRRLHSAILDFNGPSLGAYVRHCGWRIEGVERTSTFRKGQWCDLYRVAILAEEFFRLEDAPEYADRVIPVDVSEKVDLDRLLRMDRACLDSE